MNRMQTAAEGFLLRQVFSHENQCRPATSFVGMARQPASPIARNLHGIVTSKAAVRGLLASGEESLCPKFDISSAHCAENLHSSSVLLPFYGETSRRLGSIALRDPMSVLAIQEKVQISKCLLLPQKQTLTRRSCTRALCQEATSTCWHLCARSIQV